MKGSAFLYGLIIFCICLLGPQSNQTMAERAQVLPGPAQIPPLPPRLPEGIPAFPGAWGGGMFATGGRGGRVIEVTNLKDSGSGSFRAAAEDQGPRIVVFRVAGIIRLESNIDIDHPDITIAGQSAPGDGICLAYHSLNINTENVNWRHRTMDGGDETLLVNVINNYYKPGPATNDNMQSTIARIEERDMYSPGRRFEPGNWYPDMGKRPGKWYVAGNIVEGFPAVTADNWKGIRSSDRGGAPGQARVNTPFEGWPVRQETALEAFASVLAKAGATLPKRDAVDGRVTASVRTGIRATANGIVNDPREVGGYPGYSFSPDDVPVDSDHDGTPDAWETKHQLDPARASDGAIDADGDGYTNVEEYLNGTNPRQKIDYTNLGNNVDTIS